MEPASILRASSGHLMILPSLTLRAEDLTLMPGVSSFEERLLFFLLLLRFPDVKITYVTSTPIEPALIDYYLDFLTERHDAKRRLTLVSPTGQSSAPLTQRLLSDPEAISQLHRAVSGEEGSCILVPFNVTPFEEKLAETLGVQLYGPSAASIALGTKSSGRMLAESLNIPVVQGVSNIRTRTQLQSALASLCCSSSDFVLKLNDGHAGLTNMLISTDTRHSTLRSASCRSSVPRLTLESMLDSLERRGGVLERRLDPHGLRAPSAAIEIDRAGAVSILATHEQALSGDIGQTFSGCRYPAEQSYRPKLERYALTIGRALASKNVMGIVGIDFLVEASNKQNPYFCELNLRLGGTTHPLGISTNLAGADRQFRPDCHYVSTDRLESNALPDMPAHEIVSHISRSHLAFSHESRTGVVLHMAGSAPAGKIGVTCIGPDPNSVDDILRDTQRLFS